MLGRKLIAYSLVALFFFAYAALAPQQPCEAQSPGKRMSEMSDKELFKKGEADYAQGRLQEAREDLLLAFKKKKKRDKKDEKYEVMLASINSTLADERVAEGEAACAKNDFAACEASIKAARGYTETPRLLQLEAKLQSTLANAKAQFDAALKQSEQGNHDVALFALRSLGAYSTYLPNLDAEAERVKGQLIAQLFKNGAAELDARQWDKAAAAYQRVFTFSPDNSAAREGLATVEAGRNAHSLSSQAEREASAGQFSAALKDINSAEALYTRDSTRFNEIRNRIARQAVEQLLAQADTLLANQSNLEASRDACLLLEQVRELDPANATVAARMPDASVNFGANALEQAGQLEALVDYSRIATAYVMKLTAQQRMPAGTIQPEELKSVAGIFNRKRASQLLLSVENLSAAPEAFMQTVNTRARANIDNLGLPDLKTRTLESYQQAPNEDPQFQDLRPDGKSATALLSIRVSRFESERNSAETPTPVQSRYVSGTQMTVNPEYLSAQEELSRMRRALDDPARKDKDKDRPTASGWTERLYQQKLLELQKIERNIPKPTISEYTYQKIEHRQHTTVTLEVTLRDFLTREVIASDQISFNNEKEAVEITGVREQDVTGAQNQPVRLPSTEQVLREAERSVLESLSAKIPTLLQAYTSRFFKEGERKLQQGQADEATELFLCHWALMRGRLAENQALPVLETIKKQTGYDLDKKDKAAAFLSLLTSVASTAS